MKAQLKRTQADCRNPSLWPVMPSNDRREVSELSYFQLARVADKKDKARTLRQHTAYEAPTRATLTSQSESVTLVI